MAADDNINRTSSHAQQPRLSYDVTTHSLIRAKNTTTVDAMDTIF
jgi:hypothetical protein